MVVVGYRSIGAEVDGKDLAERERALPDPLPARLVVLAGMGVLATDKGAAHAA
jgi:hypothetical protein